MNAATTASTSKRMITTPPKNSEAWAGRVAISRLMYVSTPRFRNTNEAMVKDSAKCTWPNASGPR
jgi:hypothetical protein